MPPPTWGELVQILVQIVTFAAIWSGLRAAHKQMNSRLDELVRASSAAARSEGQQEGRREAQDESEKRE